MDRPSRTPAGFAATVGIDLLAVIVFVLIGRASHGEGVLGLLVTLWPFAAGLVIGWLGARAWRKPLALLPTGVIVWAVTVVVGMILRAVSGQGVQVSVVIVTAVVLAVFLLGWRLVVRLVGRSRRRP